MKRMAIIMGLVLLLGSVCFAAPSQTQFPPVPATGTPLDATFWTNFMKPSTIRPGQTWEYAMACDMIKIGSSGVTGDQAASTLTVKIGNDGKVVATKGSNDMATTPKMMIYLDALTVELMLETMMQQSPNGLFEYRSGGIEDILVKAGTYRTAMIYKTDASGNKSEQQWFAPGIGLIKRMVVDSKQGITYRLTTELVSYTP